MSAVAFLEATTTRGERVILRPPESADLDRCLRWRNQPETRPLINAVAPFSRNSEREWLEKAARPLRPNPTELTCAIEAGEDHVGMMGLHEIEFVHRHATAGMVIGEREARGRFEELNLQTLRAEVFEHNQASVRLQLACGYTLVGRLPRWMFEGGAYRDLLTPCRVGIARRRLLPSPRRAAGTSVLFQFRRYA